MEPSASALEEDSSHRHGGRELEIGTVENRGVGFRAVENRGVGFRAVENPSN